MPIFRSFFIAIIALGLFLAIAYLTLAGIQASMHSIAGTNPSILAASIAAVASVTTFVVGKYIDRRQEIESHFRSEKIKIYDAFINDIFTAINSSQSLSQKALTETLQAWHQKLIIWGGPEVVRSCYLWMDNLRNNQPTVRSLQLLENFFFALRSDVGQSSKNLDSGIIMKLILRQGDLFTVSLRKNPNMTLEDLAKLEQSLTDK